MQWEGWFTVGLVTLFVIGLALNWGPADLISVGFMTILVVVAEITGTSHLPHAKEAIQEFGNSGLITVATLFVVVAGLSQTGAMTLVSERLLRRPKSVFSAQARLLFPVTTVSAFVANTPVVAMFMPVVHDLRKKTGFSPSKLYLPMSYAATFGGVCTLIGTSTNLVVNDLWIKTQHPSLKMLDPTWVGVPCAIGGIAFFLIFGRMLLPDRKPAISLGDDPRQYTVEMTVDPAGPIVGKTIEQAGLRHLPGLFLAEIDREGDVLPAVAPKERLRPNDRLIFAGILDSVVDLRKMRGLLPATNQVFKLDSPLTQRCLIEAVVSDRCPLIGKTVRDGRFRTRYNAAVLALARSGRRITGKIGDIVLQPGDTLLLEAHQDFVELQRNSRDFFLVGRVENSAPLRHERAWLALSILLAVVIVASFDWLDILPAALLGAGAMILTRCCTGNEARQSIDLSVLLVIGAALAIGDAFSTSGAAEYLSRKLIENAGSNPHLALLAVYFVTMVFTELITNNAAAALVFPIGMATATSLGVNPMPFVMAILIGASAGFITPFGAQTNMMVYGPGGYEFMDFVRVGIPLNLIFLIITVVLCPFIWPFHLTP